MKGTMTGLFLEIAVAIQWILMFFVVFGLLLFAEFVTANRTMSVIVHVQLSVLTVFAVALLLGTVSVWGFFLIPPGMFPPGMW